MNHRRFKYFMPERIEFSTTGQETLLSVSEYFGVKPRSEAFDKDSAKSRAESLEGYRRVYAGDFVMNYMLAWKGAYGVSEYDGIVSPAYAVYRINPLYADRRFIHHHLRSPHMHSVFKAQSKGIIDSRLRLYPDTFLSMRIDLPDLDTQKAIADFLDRETDCIDQVIKKKQRLIELLTEKRKALITHTVTRGLDPDDPDRKRDHQTPEGSGEASQVTEKVCQVYREIPSGWKLQKIKFFADICNSNVDKIISEGEKPVRLCNYTDVYYNERITPDLHFMQGSATTAEIRRFQLKSGQVLITKDSESWDDIGIPALVTESMSDVLCGYHLAIIKPYKALDGGFFAWLGRSDPLNDQFKLAANGVTRFGIGLYAMKNAFISLPSITIQKTIADFLDRETYRIDQLIEKTQQSITLLSEFRSVLITAAVTSQIDVTTWKKNGRTDRHLDQIKKEMEA